MKQKLKTFTKTLSDEYPEKFVFLMGVEYKDLDLLYFIENNNLTIHTFKPFEFKKYLDE